MLDALRRLLGSPKQIGGDATHAVNPESADVGADDASEVRFAACVLLVELALVDGQFSDIERQRIHEILQRQFGVDAESSDALIAEATSAARRSVDDFTFTRQVVEHYSLAQRQVLAELMWQVVLADGTLDAQESYLMRKLANLLRLEPAYLSQARKKIEGGG